MLTSKVTVSPSKAGTKKKPQGVKLTYKRALGDPGRCRQARRQTADVLFPKGSLYNGGKYAKCAQSVMERGGPASARPSRSWAPAAAPPTPTRS